MPTPPKTGRKVGPPTKKNEAIIGRLIAVAKLGLPYAIVAQRCGITKETLLQWRAKDAELDRQLDQARAEAAEAAWRKIMAAGESGMPNSWQALAWRLERSHPESFARPEVQLGVQINQTTVNNLTISVEDAEGLARRAKPIDQEVDKIITAHQAKVQNLNGADRTGRDHIREVETELMSSGASSAITLPPAEQRHCHWWAMLSRGDGFRRVTPEAANFIIKTVVTDALGASRAAGLRVQLDDGPDSSLTLRDVWDALADLCGPAGWTALTRRGEQ